MSTKRSRLKRQPIIDLATDDDEENEETVRIARIKAPIIWSTTPAGFVIQDISESQFEDCKELIIEHFLKTDLLCRNAKISEEPESIKNYIDAQMNILRDKCSICVMEKETQLLAGILLLRAVHKSEFSKVSSRIKITDGERYKKIRRICNYFNRKNDIFTKYECESYMRCYLLATHPNFRKRGLGLHLLRAAVNVTRSLKLPVIMGIFNTVRLQNIAKKVGFETVAEIYYVDWIENGEIVFGDPGAGNYTINLMAGKITPLT